MEATYEKEFSAKVELDKKLKASKAQLAELEATFPPELAALKIKIAEVKRDQAECEQKTQILAVQLEKAQAMQNR